MTKFLKKDQLSSNWFEIDAKNAVVGRLATVISKIIRGKNKTTFTPHMDDGDFVVVKKFDKKTIINEYVSLFNNFCGEPDFANGFLNNVLKSE